MILTSAEYARLYAVLAPCEMDYCMAQRGEMCRNRNGKQSPNFWHGCRGRAVDEIRRKDRKYYERMRQQVVQERLNSDQQLATAMIGGGC